MSFQPSKIIKKDETDKYIILIYKNEYPTNEFNIQEHYNMSGINIITKISKNKKLIKLMIKK